MTSAISLSSEDAEIIMLRNSARSLGIFRAQWLADYYRRHVRRYRRRGCWRPGRKIWWCRLTWKHFGCMLAAAHEALAQLETAPGGKLTASHSAVLSPFDPVVWDRKRAEQLFNFQLSPGVLYPGAEASVWLLCSAVATSWENWSGGWTVKYIAKAGSLEIFALCGWRRGRSQRGLEQGCAGRLTTFAHWQSATRILCRRLPEGLFVGRSRLGNRRRLIPAPAFL